MSPSLFCCLRNTEEGKTLVICCEGNAGFYEIGIMATPITCGYSTLGKLLKQMKQQQDFSSLSIAQVGIILASTDPPGGPTLTRRGWRQTP